MQAFDSKNGLIEFYQELIRDESGFFTKEQKEELAHARGRLIDEQFSIVIAGRFSAGKSYLINRTFLKTDILPSHVNPTTCLPLYIEHGDGKQLQVDYSDGSTDIIEESSESISAAIKQLGTHSGKKSETCARLVLRWNDNKLLKNGIVLVDTIGTEDIGDQEYISKTEAEMEKASAVVFVFSAKQAGTATETEFLKKFMANSSKRLFIVINKVDTLDSDEDRAKVLNDFKARLTPIFQEHGIRADDRIFMVSAKMGTGLDELREHLVRFIEKQRIIELVKQHAHLIQCKLEIVSNDIDKNLRDLMRKKEGDIHKLQEIKQKIEYYEEEWITRQSELQNLELELAEKAIDNLKNELKQLRNQALRSLENLNRNALSHKLTETIENLESRCRSIGNQLQSDIRKEFNKKLDNWQWEYADRIHESFSDYVKDYNALSYEEIALKTGKWGGAATSVGGGGTLAYGAFNAVSAYVTALSAPVVKIGLLSQAWTALVGGTTAAVTTVAPTTAAATAAWAAGGAFVTGGGIALMLGLAAFKILDHVELDKIRAKTEETIKEMIKEVEIKVIKSIQDYTNQQMEKHINTIIDKMVQDKNRLQSIISEDDIAILQSQIDEKSNRKKRVQDALQKLSGLVV